MNILKLLVKRAANPDTAPRIVDFANAKPAKEFGPNQLKWLHDKHPAIGKMHYMRERVEADYVNSAITAGHPELVSHLTGPAALC